jgi:DNA-binding XRE family transcriptional regulator
MQRSAVPDEPWNPSTRLREAVTHDKEENQTGQAITAARQALGLQLAALRRAAGYSQKDFAPLTGYRRGTVANVETGRQNAPRVFWERCAQALGQGLVKVGVTVCD